MGVWNYGIMELLGLLGFCFVEEGVVCNVQNVERKRVVK